MLNTIMSILSNPAVITVAMLIIESLLHVIPSEKALGVMHGVTAVVDKISSVSAAVASFLDKIIPQNVTAPAASPTQPPAQG